MNKKAYTMTDVLFAFLIMSIAFVAILQSTIYIYRANNNNILQKEAEIIGESILEGIMSKDISEIYNISKRVYENDNKFRYEVKMSTYDLGKGKDLNIKKIEVIVYYENVFGVESNVKFTVFKSNEQYIGQKE